ncbi:MAG TPA: GNAT family N-acetyltransferase [Xanthomonadaceae bacterium]|jgi:predicted GNAT family acetyltransferase|nr:GNAT family N-acetyltransferase [Xanthomonadaceae bacterium]
MDFLIGDNPGAQRFETIVDGQLCVLDYGVRGRTLLLNHAGVPSAVGGRGIAAALTKHALDSARQRGMDVVPNCSYVAAWITRHPIYADLVRIDS